MRIVAILALLPSLTLAADPLASGVAVGKRPGPYSFLVATGKERGQPTCFICEQADKPGAVVFARSLSEPLGKLLAGLDAEMASRKDFKAWMTLLTTKADLDELADWAKKHGLKQLPVGAFEDADGPPAYTLHADADITLMLFEKKKVLENKAFRKGELTPRDAETLVRDLVKGLSK